MSRTTTLTGVITLPNKQIALTEQIAIREQANIHFTGYSPAGPADLILAIVYDGALMAKLQPMVDYTTYAGGVLSTNTTQIVAVFEGMAANARVKMSIVVWDVTNKNALVNDWIWIQNSPYDPSMQDPTPVDPITPGIYALIENGVTHGDGHIHQTGDGGDLKPYFIARIPAGGFFRQSADGLDLELRDRVDGSWRTLILANGSLGVGPSV